MTRLLILATLLYFFIVSAYADTFKPPEDPFGAKQIEQQIKDILEDTQSIKNASLPTSDINLSERLTVADNSINNDKNLLANIATYTSYYKRLLDKISEVETLRDNLAKLDCENDAKDGGGAFASAYQQYQKMQSSLVVLSYQNGIDTDFMNVPGGKTWKEACEAIRASNKSPNTKTGTEEKFNYLKGYAQAVIAKYDTLTNTIKGRIEANTDLRNKVESSLESPGRAVIITYLPWILVILGTASVLTIIAIKLFDDEIQMEWVASGQVIQFVTVMILLSVITALALSNILSENTLGTLLGGIGGYVLAQGVGRAAATNALRSRRRSSD